MFADRLVLPHLADSRSFTPKMEATRSIKTSIKIRHITHRRIPQDSGFNKLLKF
jgi:hypothetical protein